VSDHALRLIVIGPGRAGGALALAAARAGIHVVGVMSRSETSRFGPVVRWGAVLPPADLALVAVKDEAISEVVDQLSGAVGEVGVVAHVSGFVPVEVLGPLRSEGTAIGGFHPLQTLPDPDRGAEALRGSFAGIGGDAGADEVLRRLAVGLGMIPFALDDGARPAYHAAAAASSNFVVAALGLAGDLFAAAGVDPLVARPLVERVVANVFTGGAASALTGPIARGDLDTVRGHLAAAFLASQETGRQFRLMAEATAIRAGREEDLEAWK
jgi:predicted short-subunit dehydrogenase-like oxidoreductase (DUF2520 family)